MAVAIIALTATMITPPLFIAAVSRVQQRRAEQAFQLAQGEVDRFRVLVARGQHLPARLPVAVGGIGNNPPPTATDLDGATPAPNTIAPVLDTVNPACPGTLYVEQQLQPNEVRPTDVDGDCQADFYVQVFRTAGTVSRPERSSGTRRPSRFLVGVRVYSFLAKDSLDAGTALEKEPINLNITGEVMSQRTNPLSVVYTDVRWTEQSEAACDYFTNTGDCQ